MYSVCFSVKRPSLVMGRAVSLLSQGAMKTSGSVRMGRAPGLIFREKNSL